MVESKTNGNGAELPDYDEYVLEPDENEAAAGNGTTTGGAAAKPTAYVGVHSTSFKDMLLKPEL